MAELIIKPTGRCNFNCSFCSAADLDIPHPVDNRVPKALREYIQKLNPMRLIITGGEPLTLDPGYYYDLHDFFKGPMSVTSNLKDFYFNPDKWSKLFNEPWFSVGTSFNYGDGRKWDKDTVYTEEKFLEVSELFKKYVGYNPQFIAVIDDNNEHLAIEHVLLAKKLDTKVKLNPAIGVGRQGKTYQRYRMFRHYINIIDMGLEKYECNCIDRGNGICPKNIGLRCNNSVRCCYVNRDGKLNVSICDETMSMGIEVPEDEICPGELDGVQTPISYDDYITPQCSYCELCRLCNGCNVNRAEAKKDPNYCNEMSKLKDDIIRTGWDLYE